MIGEYDEMPVGRPSHPWEHWARQQAEILRAALAVTEEEFGDLEEDLSRLRSASYAGAGPAPLTQKGEATCRKRGF